MAKPTTNRPPQPNIFALLKPYRGLIFLLLLVTIISNGLNLVLPRIISKGIDAYTGGTFIMRNVVLEFALIALGILVLTVVQGIVQTYASERAGRDLRTKFIDKISRDSYAAIQTTTPSRILTNLTADVDSIKMFISMGIPSLISSVVLIIGASVLLFVTNWKLALAVIMIIPIIGISFFLIFKNIHALFMKAREVIDWLNKVINESILGSALVRVLNSQKLENNKFVTVNSAAKDNGMAITRLFAALIPVIGFVANLGILIILVLGGRFVVNGGMSLGDFAAFQSYVIILIFPIVMLGFMSSLIGQAVASYGRIEEILNKKYDDEKGTIDTALVGNVEVKNIVVTYGEKKALKNVSFSAKAGTKTAIIGPTAAGKTQLLNVLIGLLAPTEGTVSYDGRDVSEYNSIALHKQIGIVFQDSVMFNLSIKENIAFGSDVKEADMQKAIETAELGDFITNLPNGLDTIVSERGTSLSGGQKQRIMLARSLALNPKVLLLDDFTARVDRKTEDTILENIAKNYPTLTLISVTQKISSVENYDQIIVLMEGEVLATGTHSELMKTSPEYVQIYDSQESTHAYELQA